ncbi:MAG: ABC transporter ATP-binding protein [Alphaproteobacteria bacterium]
MSQLEIRNLSKRFGGIQAVNDVSLAVRQGEILGIIGPNGAGKSTLFELISGTQSADRGSITFNGRELTGLASYRISRLGVARTFQKLRPFLGMTVVDNVMVSALVHEPRIRAARATALECIEFVGITHKRDAMANTLSTGQRKRLELARVMAKKPAVYLLDEVMAGVDHKSIGGLVELIGRLRDHGGTVVLIEHNLTVVRLLCDRVIAMHLGAKIDDGLPDAVLANETVVRAYVGE